MAPTLLLLVPNPRPARPVPGALLLLLLPLSGRCGDPVGKPVVALAVVDGRRWADCGRKRNESCNVVGPDGGPALDPEPRRRRESDEAEAVEVDACRKRVKGKAAETPKATLAVLGRMAADMGRPPCPVPLLAPAALRCAL